MAGQGYSTGLHSWSTRLGPLNTKLIGLNDSEQWKERLFVPYDALRIIPRHIVNLR